MYYAEEKKAVKSSSHQVHRLQASPLMSRPSYQRSHRRWKAPTCKGGGGGAGEQVGEGYGTGYHEAAGM